MRRERRGREGMVQTESVTARAALKLRVPGTLCYSWVVMPPHVLPSQRRKPVEVLRAYECPPGFVQPVRARILVADEQERLMQSGFRRL